MFLSENTITHCHLVSNPLEIQSRTSFIFSQSQHSKRLLNITAHKNSIKYNPFLYILLYQIKKQHLFLLLVTIFWISTSGCSKLALTLSVTWVSYTYKIALVIKECKRLPLVTIKTSSFIKCGEHFYIAGGITRIYVFHKSSYLVVKLTETCTHWFSLHAKGLSILALLVPLSDLHKLHAQSRPCQKHPRK